MPLGFKARAAGEGTVQLLADHKIDAVKLLIREQEVASSPSRPATRADAQIAMLRMRAAALGVK